MFRFIPGNGGHANEPDLLVCTFAYRTTADLMAFFDYLGVKLKSHGEAPQPQMGEDDNADSSPDLIQDTGIEQPKHCEVEGIALYAWCKPGEIDLTVNVGSYVVTEAHYAAAEELEAFLWKAPLRALYV